MHRLLTRRDLCCYLAIPLVIYMAWFAVSALDKPPSMRIPAPPVKTVTAAHIKPMLLDKTEEVTSANEVLALTEHRKEVLEWTNG